MLQRRRDGEGREDDGEDEEVVDGQALLDEVTGEELERALRPEPEVHRDVEEQGEEDPDGAPDQGFADVHRVRSAVNDAEVQSQHGQHEDGEADPQGRSADAFYPQGSLPFLATSGDPPVATSAHTGQPAERGLASLRARRGTVSRVPTSANNARCKTSRTLSREPDRSRRRRAPRGDRRGRGKGNGSAESSETHEASFIPPPGVPPAPADRRSPPLPEVRPSPCSLVTRRATARPMRPAARPTAVYASEEASAANALPVGRSRTSIRQHLSIPPRGPFMSTNHTVTRSMRLAETTEREPEAPFGVGAKGLAHLGSLST